jgi:hypothetical protein
MTPRALKMEFWISVFLASASAALLGFLLLAVARGRFPEILFPFVERCFGTKENAAVAADLGLKLGAASVAGLFLSLGGFVHYLLSRRKVTNAAMRS